MNQSPSSERALKGEGVSIVICCHNSAQRLPETLAHLRAQEVPDELAWEVVVVDNASTDDTGEVARRLWPADAPASLRIIRERRAGLAYARERGIAAAAYELLSFIDDDNWVSPNWVRRVVEVMAAHPDVGACGGAVEAVAEGDLPPWFSRYQSQYAVGLQAKTAGDVTEGRGWLWGAGLTVRMRAIQQLRAAGFRSLVTGRSGSKLSAGEDVELCYALRQAGWRLWYDPSLRLKHFLPGRRLTWSYLRRLARGAGAGTVGRDAYRFAWEHSQGIRTPPWRQTWQVQTTLTAASLLRVGAQYLKYRGRSEGHPKIIAVERQVGRLMELLRWRGAYNTAIREIANAPWIRHGPDAALEANPGPGRSNDPVAKVDSTRN